MSRVGKQEIQIPEKTEVIKNDDGSVSVKGPLGELNRAFTDHVKINIADNTITFEPKDDSPRALAMWGTVASHIKNMVDGVNQPFVKNLVVDGVGYRVEQKGDELHLVVGFSHPVVKKIPEGVNVSIEKNEITISGIDKELVGKFASQVRLIKKPEPYKGKGIYYKGETIRRKEGKKSV